MSIDSIKVFKGLNKRIISFNRAYVEITGSVTAALLLSQLCYWASKHNYNWFHNTNEELCEQTGLSPSELKTAKKIIKELELVEYELRNIPAKTHYFVKIDKIIAMLENNPVEMAETSSWAKTAQLDGELENDCEKTAKEAAKQVGRKPPNLMGENRPTNNIDTKINTNIPPTPQGGKGEGDFKKSDFKEEFDEFCENFPQFVHEDVINSYQKALYHATSKQINYAARCYSARMNRRIEEGKSEKHHITPADRWLTNRGWLNESEVSSDMPPRELTTEEKIKLNAWYHEKGIPYRDLNNQLVMP